MCERAVLLLTEQPGAWLPPPGQVSSAQTGGPRWPAAQPAFRVPCAASHTHTFCFSKHLGSRKRRGGKQDGKLR